MTFGAPMDSMMYQVALNDLITRIGQAIGGQVTGMRGQFLQRVNTLVSQARAAGVDDSWIIPNILVDANAYDAALAQLADVTIPQELIRVQHGGTPNDDVSAFLPPPAPVFPPFPAPGYVAPLPSQSQPLAVSPYHTLLPEITNVPAGMVVDYGNLTQLIQQAQDAGDVATANALIDQKNAITLAGPQPINMDRAHADTVAAAIASGSGYLTIQDLQNYPYLFQYLTLAQIRQGLMQQPAVADQQAGIQYLDSLTHSSDPSHPAYSPSAAPLLDQPIDTGGGGSGGGVYVPSGPVSFTAPVQGPGAPSPEGPATGEASTAGFGGFAALALGLGLALAAFTGRGGAIGPFKRQRPRRRRRRSK
jgi:hypothetical protein